MAFGGGGSANYTANFILNTSQAEIAAKQLATSLTRSMGAVDRAAKMAMRSQLTQADKMVRSLTGQAPAAAAKFSGGTMTKSGVMKPFSNVPFDQLSRAQIAALSKTDKFRLKLVQLRSELQMLARSGNVSATGLNKIALQADQLASKTNAVRSSQLKRFSKGLRDMANDLLNTQRQVSNAFAPGSPVAAAAAPPAGGGGFWGRFKNRFGGGGGGQPPTAAGAPHPSHGRSIPPGMERGQMMPIRTREEAKALLYLSSAGQGAMLAMSALSGNITGLAFGLVFLGYGLVKVALLFAALTAAMALSIRFFKTIISQSAKAGAAMEAFGQRMSSFFQDAARSQKDLTKATNFAKTFGLDINDARQVTFELDKMGMATETYMTMIANVSAVTGKNIVQVNEEFLAIQKAKFNDQKGLMEQFTKDLDLGTTRYANSLDMAIAINKRFANAAKDAGNTQLGMIAKIKAAWADFTTNVGSVLEGFFKPILIAVMAFVEGMGAGFDSAKQNGITTGDLAKTTANFAEVIRKITPFLVRLGWVLGKVVYYSMIGLAKVIKIVSDVLIRLWNKIKPVIDVIRTWIPKIKELIDKLVSWYQKHKDLIDSLGKILLGLILFEAATRVLMGTLNAAIGMVAGLFNAIVGLAKLLAETNLGKMIKLGVEGVAAVLKALADIATAIANLAGKTINIGANIAMDALRGLGGLLDDLLNKIKNINNTPVKPQVTAPPPVDIKVNPPKEPPGGWFGKIAPRLMIPTDFIAMGLATALRAAAAHPAVAAAMLIISAIILAGIFPKQTGQITKEAIDWVGAIMVTLVGTFVRMQIRLQTAWILMWRWVFTTALPETVKFVMEFIQGLFGVFEDLLGSVFSGLKDIVEGIITLNFKQALTGAWNVLKAIYWDFPINLFNLMKDSAMQIITEVIPAVGEALLNGLAYIFEPIMDVISKPLNAAWEFAKNWVEQFKEGWFEEKFDAVKSAIRTQLDGIGQDFADLFDATGVKSLATKVASFFTNLGNIVTGAPEMFGKVLGWLSDLDAGFLEVFAPDGVKSLVGLAGGFFNGLATLVGSQLNPFIKVANWLGDLFSSFFDIFDFGGFKSIANMVRNAFNDIINFMGSLTNPFERIFGWLDPIIDKIAEVIDWFNRIPGVSISAPSRGGRGGGGTTSYGGGGGSYNTGSGLNYMMPATIENAWLLFDGSHSKWLVRRSHQQGQDRGTVELITDGTQLPNLSKWALGGRVPGRPGTKVPVLADAGEMFLGHPSLASGSGREARYGGGGDTNVSIYVDVRDSVVDNEAADRIANNTAAKIMRSMSGNRQMTFHRIGG